MGRIGTSYRGFAPTYFASSEARQRIARTMPGAKVDMHIPEPRRTDCLAFTELDVAHGMIPWSFEEALYKDKENSWKSSKYATHLLAWQQSLGRNHVLATLYDDLLESPQAYIDDLCQFLGIRRFTAGYGHEASTHLRVIGATSLAHGYTHQFTRSRVVENQKAQIESLPESAIPGSVNCCWLQGCLPNIYHQISRKRFTLSLRTKSIG
jgi:hypothetical protein